MTKLRGQWEQPSISAQGHERRFLQPTAPPRLPLYTVSDQTRAALQYVATGQKQTRQRLVDSE